MLNFFFAAEDFRNFFVKAEKKFDRIDIFISLLFSPFSGKFIRFYVKISLVGSTLGLLSTIQIAGEIDPKYERCCKTISKCWNDVGIPNPNVQLKTCFIALRLFSVIQLIKLNL